MARMITASTELPMTKYEKKVWRNLFAAKAEEMGVDAYSEWFFEWTEKLKPMLREKCADHLALKLLDGKRERDARGFE